MPKHTPALNPSPIGPEQFVPVTDTQLQQLQAGIALGQLERRMQLEADFEASADAALTLPDGPAREQALALATQNGIRLHQERDGILPERDGIVAMTRGRLGALAREVR